MRIRLNKMLYVYTRLKMLFLPLSSILSGLCLVVAAVVLLLLVSSHNRFLTFSVMTAVRWKPREEGADKATTSSGGRVQIFPSLVSSASHRKLMSLIIISSLSTHTSHHPINQSQRATHSVQVAHSRGGLEAFSPLMCEGFFFFFSVS